MITYEADQRHVDILLRAFNLNESSKTKSVPWDKESFRNRPVMLGKELNAQQSGEYRSLCMRQLFLALDRSDLQFVGKECSRAMSTQTVNAMETLKGAARYLLGHRLVV